MGTIGLSRESARADAVPAPVATNASNVISVSGFFNEDDSCSTGVTTCAASVSVSPATAVTVGLALVRCDIDLNSNGSVADEAVVANPGNCVGPADSDASAAIYSLSNAVVAGLDGNALDTVNNLWRLNLQFTCNTLVATVLTITYQQDNIASSTTVTCNASGGVPVLAITKIDQNGTLRSAAFGLFPGAGAVNSIPSGLALVQMSTGTTPTSNPCLSNTTCAVSPNTQNQNGLWLPLANAAGVTIPTGVEFFVQEIGTPSNCSLVEIKLGGASSITVLPLTLPVSLTFDGAAWTVKSNSTPFGTVNGTRLDLTYVNSCLIAGGASTTGSSIAVVIGGSTYGLTNTTHVEIVPAPGSDNDARIDLRIRDVNNIPLANAHVTLMTDRGALAMRVDTSSAGIINGVPNGYDVVEPTPNLFGSNRAGDTCDQFEAQLSSTNTGGVAGQVYNGFVYTPLYTGSRQVQDGYTDVNGLLSACLYVDGDLAPGTTPGKANLTAIVENNYFGAAYNPLGFSVPQNLVVTGTVTVVGPPASVKVAASPTSVQCGEKSTITATVTDSVGQNVSDHTRVELVSNYGSTIGGTGATLGFPGQGLVNPISSSAAETFSGVATAFLLTSTEHVGPYEVVVATGGSTAGWLGIAGPTYGPSGSVGAWPSQTVNQSVGSFSTAPVSAQVTVTCALPSVAAPVVPPIVAPRTGEGIRPPNTGDAGLADSSGGSMAFVLAGAVAFALAGVATVKFARR
jgi:hypothetical protein